MKATKMLVWVMLVVWAASAGAQYEDEQTRDHEDQDRRYYERYTKKPEEERTSAVVDEPSEEEQTSAYLARAEELIRDKSYRSSSADHYRVQTDDPRLDADAAVALLESFRSFFDEFLSGRTEMQAYDETSRAFLFYSFYKFNQLIVGDWKFRELRPNGHYRAEFDVLTLHTDADPSSVGDALVHEAAHQLVEQRLFGHGHSPPLWLSEGLATYFGYTLRDSSGRFLAGEVGGKNATLIRGVPARSSDQARASLRGLRRRLTSRDAEGGIADVIAIRDPNRFFGDAALMHYAASWLVIHYLIHGDDGAHAPAFFLYLAGAVEGRSDPQTLYSAIGMDRSELESGVIRHLKRVKVR